MEENGKSKCNSKIHRQRYVKYRHVNKQNARDNIFAIIYFRKFVGIR